MPSDEEAFEELDPTGRFGRYAAVLGLGSVKKVYRWFDQEEGIEVAWNRLRVRALAAHALADRDPAMVDSLHAKVRLLRSLHHDHIIGFHKVWLDRDHGVPSFITEVCNSGSLRDYRDRHKHVSVKFVKNWARQILEGLDHLHTHDPASSTATSTAGTSSSTATPDRIRPRSPCYLFCSPCICSRRPRAAWSVLLGSHPYSSLICIRLPPLVVMAAGRGSGHWRAASTSFFPWFVAMPYAHCTRPVNLLPSATDQCLSAW